MSFFDIIDEIPIEPLLKKVNVVSEADVENVLKKDSFSSDDF